MVVFIELFKALPGLSHGLLGIAVALSIIGWVSTARLARGIVLQLREETYVESARALGARGRRILLRHILPNALGPLLVILTYRIPVAILSESTLSFIGLGIQPPLASWGTLAYDGWTALRSFPHLLVSPALAIFFTILPNPSIPASTWGPRPGRTGTGRVSSIPRERRPGTISPTTPPATARSRSTRRSTGSRRRR
jgi:ABC-type dipeptide/oligopeptide/nickel transport system permease subunit